MYSTWSVVQLKTELRKRGASVVGKKAALIQRLEDYDRNNKFEVELEDQTEDKIPNIPGLDKFRDVNASTNLPAISKCHIQEFAGRFGVPAKGRLLYENRCLVTLRVAFEGNYVYFHAQCKAQMKKLLYIVLLKIENSGMIEESHCECAAGSGLEAHCKHIFTVLYGIEDMVSTKTIIMHKVCTEELMLFKKPKRMFYHSPIQSKDLSRKKNRISPILYCPILENNIMDNYQDYVNNLAIGFATTHGSKMPYLQLIKPANPYALEGDHDYLQKSAKDILKENLLLYNINEQKIEDVQANTILQDASKDWYLFRKIRITASNFHAVCHSRGNRLALLNNILYPKKFFSRATTHGKVHESIAIEKYETYLDTKINKCGLCISFTHPFLAASPDGLLGTETVIEVKCPYVCRYCVISPNTVPYLHYDSNGELKLKKKHCYYTQIQGQLFCTKRKFCNLIIFTFVDMKVIYIERDDFFINDMVPKLTSFYEECLEPAIYDKYLYKQYDSIIKPS